VPTERAAFRRIVTEADDPRPAIAVARGALAGAVATILIASSSLEPRAVFLGDPMRNTKTIVVMTAVASATAPLQASSDYCRAVMDSSPSSYWRFEELSGIASNEVNGADSGTVAGNTTRGVQSASPGLGNCYRFAGGEVRIPGSAAIWPSLQFSVELWIKVETVTHPTQIVSIDRDANPGSLAIALYGSSSIIAAARRNSPNPTAAEAFWRWTPAEILQWHHLVFTHDGNSQTAALYVDGSLVDTRPFDRSLFATTTQPLYIGKHNWPGADYYYLGLVDEVAFYQRALTESEIRAHYCAAGIDSATCCPADLNQDGQVNGSDIAVLLGFWGPTGTAFPAADINQDGIVNGSDLAAVLTAWGPCAP
jgi:Concanavalin A-like lectin/glucanases superfamily/Dockerin type I domain